MKLIVTHPGSSHKDDFLACCILAHLHGVTIHRREPTEDDLSTPDTCVVDTGGIHDATLKNFDHHQFPRDAPPQCALSLVLRDLDIYDDALAFCPWLRPAEWLDTLGPNETAKRMGIPRSAFSELNSPIDMTMLNRFAAQPVIQPGEVLHQLMCMVGEDILGYVRSVRTRLNFLDHHCQWWNLDSQLPDENPICVLFLEKNETIAKDPSFAVHAYITEQNRESQVHALVYPDRRGDGYGMTTYEDCPRLNFSLIANEADVRFAHKRGFVAKVETTAPERLKELVRMATVIADK